MKVHLKLPEGHETAVTLSLLPKAGENLDYGGVRYVIAAVVHTAETAKTTLELLRFSAPDGFSTIRLNDMVRYRTSEIRAFSPPVRTRY